jgi:hypothetical protein
VVADTAEVAVVARISEVAVVATRWRAAAM